MKIFAGHRDRVAREPPAPVGPVLALGNFDGVHRGHRALLDKARERARAIGGSAGVFTFDPHPAHFFAPHAAPPLLVGLARRLELLAAAGLDFAVVEPFDAQFAHSEPEDFIRTVLVTALRVRHIVVGYDFHFGRARRGDGRLLTEVGAELGVTVDIIPPVMVDGVLCSSTVIRELVRRGCVEEAAVLLGRPAEIEGRVVAGAQRGRTLGFPTANLAPGGELLPHTGIYAAWAKIDPAGPGHPGSRLRAAVSIGTNPTFPGAKLTVEAHLLDFDGDLYDKRLRLELVARLRDEQRFDSVAALVAQISADVARTKEICS